MRKMIFVMSAVFAFAWTASAQAEMVRCVRVINGMCDTGGSVRGDYRSRAPIFGAGVRTGVMIGAPAARVYEGEEVFETRGAEVVTVGRRQHDRCPGGHYLKELDACDRHGPPTADLRGDPECKGKPPGTAFDREIVGPHGEQTVDHRMCW